jgi:hypothetical protein
MDLFITIWYSPVTNYCTSNIIYAKYASGTAEITTYLLAVSRLDIHCLLRVSYSKSGLKKNLVTNVCRDNVTVILREQKL